MLIILKYGLNTDATVTGQQAISCLRHCAPPSSSTDTQINLKLFLSFVRLGCTAGLPPPPELGDNKERNRIFKIRFKYLWEIYGKFHKSALEKHILQIIANNFAHIIMTDKTLTLLT